MRGFFAALLFFAGTAAAFCETFAEADARLRGEARAQFESAQKRADFAAKAKLLDAEISVSEAVLESLLRRAEILAKRLENARSADAPVVEKTARDKAALAEISRRLDALYAALSAAADKAGLAAEKLSVSDFGKLSASEKFSQFAEFYKQCLTADTKIYSEKPQLSTGVFARAAGRRVSGDIAEIEVEGGAK